MGSADGVSLADGLSPRTPSPVVLLMRSGQVCAETLPVAAAVRRRFASLLSPDFAARRAGSGDVRMKLVSRLVAVCFMVGGIAVLGARPVAATSDCLKLCRQQVTACKRAANKQARDCNAACRAKRADCPADATTESCPALAAARQCATTCRHQDRDQARACFDAARQCRTACPRT